MCLCLPTGVKVDTVRRDDGRLSVTRKSYGYSARNSSSSSISTSDSSIAEKPPIRFGTTKIFPNLNVPGPQHYGRRRYRKGTREVEEYYYAEDPTPVARVRVAPGSSGRSSWEPPSPRGGRVESIPSVVEEVEVLDAVPDDDDEISGVRYVAPAAPLRSRVPGSVQARRETFERHGSKASGVRYGRGRIPR